MLSYLLLLSALGLSLCVESSLPQKLTNSSLLVISTWPFVEAVNSARSVLELGGSAVNAVTEGCSTCEDLRCDGSVGYGGSPDENGETTLDAMVMDGTTMDVGAVGSLRFVKDAARAAKLVLDHTEHTLLVGDQASAFAISLGLRGPLNLSTDSSLERHFRWKQGACQPNFWKNVDPDCKKSCGPYKPHQKQLPHARPSTSTGRSLFNHGKSLFSHDTISMAAIDNRGNIAVGTSTNGATSKIAGRVGDAPIVGAGGYADTDVGACGATGDGDVMMRFLPCYQVVESMRLGLSPQLAAQDAIERIKRKFPSFVGALFAVNKHGFHAGACHGWTFQYSVWNTGMQNVKIVTVFPDQTLTESNYR